MSLHSLCMSYPELNDVWTNHLSSFLMPSLTQVRKEMTVTMFELSWRTQYAMKLPVYGRRFTIRYRSFWLTEHLVCLALTVPVCGIEGVRFILHLSDNGHLHCVISSLHKSCYILTENKWEWAQLSTAREHLCPCFWRNLMMKSIRERGDRRS
jgi:hypothetical protein